MTRVTGLDWEAPPCQQQAIPMQPPSTGHSTMNISPSVEELVDAGGWGKMVFSAVRCASPQRAGFAVGGGDP